jgi:hypothetical protein
MEVAYGLKNAEWIVQQHEQGNYSFEEDVLNKARNMLRNSPYVTFQCEIFAKFHILHERTQ